jgi:hypothetical protein
MAVGAMDNLCVRFIGMTLTDAGVEWFKQRIGTYGTSLLYKAWECLARLYEVDKKLPEAWNAHKQFINVSLRVGVKPENLKKSIRYTLDWAIRNGFSEQARGELKHWAGKVSMPLGEVVLLDGKLAPPAFDIEPEPPVRPVPLTDDHKSTKRSGLATEEQKNHQDTVDRLAATLESISTTRGLAEHASKVEEFLSSVEALNRVGEPDVVAAIRSIVRLAGDAEGVSVERGQEIGRELAKYSQTLKEHTDRLPVEIRGIVTACTKVIQGFANRFRAVSGLAVTMPHDLGMKLSSSRPGAGDL